MKTRRRRNFLSATACAVVAGSVGVLLGRPLRAAGLVRAALAVPGPGNLLYLPLTLAGRIGADRREGLELDIRYFGSGPQAFQDMLSRNSDFAAGGVTALALQRLSAKPVVSIVPLSRVPAYTLLVRADLRDKVRKTADLAGRVIGVKGYTPGGRSTSQLFTEYALSRAGVALDRVNFIPAGQNYGEQHAALASKAVDALMGDEPFASRLVREGLAYVLEDYHDPAVIRKSLGGLFLNSQLATRDDFIASRPDVVEKMVKTVKRTLAWMDRHSAKDIVDALNLPDAAERDALLATLKIHKAIYSPDGRFSAGQIATAEKFFHAVETSPAAKTFSFKSLVADRWAGVAP